MAETLLPEDASPLNLQKESDYMRRWQRIIIALMGVGYAGYYLCRSDLSVATPYLIQAFGKQGLNKVAIGGISSIGVLCYSAGKFVNGSLTDYLGGRKMFLAGMGGSVLFTMLFGLGNAIPFFTIAWALNRLIQSTGWVGMVRITSRWNSYSTYGAVMGIISLIYFFGDFLSRIFLGFLAEQGVGWRGLFYISGGVLCLIFLLNLFLMKESPAEIGEPEPPANPANVFGEEPGEAGEKGLKSILFPLFRNPIFWVICLLSAGFTLVRETFNTWTPEYLVEAVKMAPGTAGLVSSSFPLFGGISVMICGYASDRLGNSGRAAIIFFGLLFSTPALLALGFLPLHSSPGLAVFALGIVALVLIGPYSFLAGAVSLDLGGKRGCATACGWIDGIGYFGAIASGSGVGEIAQKLGWRAAFAFLALVTALSCLASAYYWRNQLLIKRKTA